MCGCDNSRLRAGFYDSTGDSTGEPLFPVIIENISELFLRQTVYQIGGGNADAGIETQVQGAILLKGMPFCSDIKLMGSINDQVAIFLANNHLYGDLQDLLMGVLHALTETIDAQEPYTRGHSQRVAAISQRLAEEMGLPQPFLEEVGTHFRVTLSGRSSIPDSRPGGTSGRILDLLADDASRSTSAIAVSLGVTSRTVRTHL